MGRESLSPTPSNLGERGADLKPLEFEYTDSTNLIFLGPRGSGKSTVAELVARRLHKHFIDLDVELKRRTGLTPGEMIDKYKEDYFRQRESDIANDVLKFRNSNLSVATGGGIVERMMDNFKVISKNGVAIYLSVSPETSLERTGEDPNRPVLTGGSRLEDQTRLITRRDPLYKMVADFEVDTNGLTPIQVVNRVVRTLNLHRPEAHIPQGQLQYRQTR